MQLNTKQASDFFCVTTSLLVTTTLNATSLPPININLSSGTGSNIITTSIGGTSIVEYKIQDLIGRFPARTWLWSAPIPSYISRVQSLHQPDCSSYNQHPENPNSFTLPPNESCYFAMQVDGTAFASIYQGSTISYRPIFSNSNGVAYGPCPSEMLFTTLTTAPIQLLIAVGAYRDTSNFTRPLLIQSQDSGTSWRYPESTTEPLFSPRVSGAGTYFTSSSCNTNLCIAAGGGEDSDGNNRRPILALTKNSTNTLPGTDWNYIPIDPPGYDPTFNSANFGQFNAASCTDQICIAAGNDLNYPLLAVTQNAGTTWTYSPSISTPVFTAPNTNPFKEKGTLMGSSCSETTCIAVGSYRDTSDFQRPLLAVSQDSGTSWTYPDSITSPTMTNHPYDSYAEFLSASCSGTTCIAVGTYMDTSNVQRPLLVLSQDSGSTWTFSESITEPSSASYTFLHLGMLRSASCYGSTCIAGGSYEDSSHIIRNLLAVSTDSGSTWTYPDSIQDPGEVTLDAWGGIFGTSCYGTTCAAVGQMAGNNPHPFVATSHDSGITWAYVTSTYTPALATDPYQSEGILNSVTCNAFVCIASGNYISSNGSINRPLVALGLDNGNNWSYVNSATSPVFTPNNTHPFYDSANLPSTSSTWTSWLANAPSWIISPPLSINGHQR